MSVQIDRLITVLLQSLMKHFPGDYALGDVYKCYSSAGSWIVVSALPGQGLETANDLFHAMAADNLVVVDIPIAIREFPLSLTKSRW